MGPKYKKGVTSRHHYITLASDPRTDAHLLAQKDESIVKVELQD